MIQLPSITFEGSTNSWIGTYKAAQHRNRSPITSLCLRCQQPFEQDRQVIVLPCRHTYHERCFTPGSLTNCPLDNSQAMGITKVTYLGYSVLFPPTTRKFGIWLSTHEEDIETKILFLKLQLSPKFPRLFRTDSREMKLIGDIIQNFLQDLLNIYEEKAQGVPQYERDHLGDYNMTVSLKLDTLVSKLKILYPKINKISFEPDEIHEIAQLIPLDFDLSEMTKKLLEVKNELLNIPGGLHRILGFLIINNQEQTGLTMISEGAYRVSQWLKLLCKALTLHPSFAPLVKEHDNRFYEAKVGSFRELQNPHSTISKLNEVSLYRLGRIAKETNKPESPLIQRQIRKIEREKILKYAALSIFFLLIFSLALSSKHINN